MYEWLEAAALRLSDEVADDPALYGLTDDEMNQILDLAGVAAHEGGHKSNAPLLSYLVGLAHGRHPDLELSEVIAGAIGERVPS